jgi:Tol biopolymer transport system component
MNIRTMKNIGFIAATVGWLWLSPIAGAAEPPPADELERSVALMAKTGSCTSPSFSPDGTRIAFVSNMSGVPQVYVMPSAGGFPEQVTALDDPVEGMMWSPKGDLLAIQVAPGGGLNSQIYVLKPDGSQLRRLTDGGKENNFLDRWSPDGKMLAISSNRREPATTDSYFVDVATGKMRMIAENKGVGGVMDISWDNRFAIVNRLINRGDNNLFLVNTESGEEALLTSHEAPGSFGSARFGPPGRTYYFTSNKGSDLAVFACVGLSTEGRLSEVHVIAARNDAEAAALEIDKEGTKLALFWNVAGKTELAFYDLKTQ